MRAKVDADAQGKMRIRADADAPGKMRVKADVDMYEMFSKLQSGSWEQERVLIATDGGIVKRRFGL